MPKEKVKEECCGHKKGGGGVKWTQNRENGGATGLGIAKVIAWQHLETP